MKKFSKTSMTLLAFLFVSLLGPASNSEAKVYEYTFDNKFSLLEDPAAAVDYKIELIKKAKHHIHILTFFWDDSGVPSKMAQALNEANARGVEVRILTTYIPTIGTDIFSKGKKALHIGSKTATFSYLTLTPGKKFSITHSLHEKIFIVDGARAIIGGRNVSDSSLAGKDMEVEMQGAVVNQVQDHFKIMYDFLNDLKVNSKCDPELDDNEQCASEIRKTQFDYNDKTFFPDQPAFVDGIKARMLSHEAILHQAQKPMSRQERLLQRDDILDTVTKFEFKKLRMYNYFIIPTTRYLNFLESNLAKGNSIEVITNSMESATFSSNLGYFYSLPTTLSLANQGLQIYQWQKAQKLNYVHEKVLVFDEDHVIIGSHNFGTGSTAVSNEIAVDFYSKSIADRLLEVFEEEKMNPKITIKANPSDLESEISKNKKKINILRKRSVELLLREIY